MLNDCWYLQGEAYSRYLVLRWGLFAIWSFVGMFQSVQTNVLELLHAHEHDTSSAAQCRTRTLSCDRWEPTPQFPAALHYCSGRPAMSAPRNLYHLPDMGTLRFFSGDLILPFMLGRWR
jgi:hypothetical protein